MAVVEEVLWRRQVIYQEKEKIEGTLKAPGAPAERLQRV